MAGSKYTFEAWMNNEILILGQHSKFTNHQLFPNITSCHPSEIPKYQLTKIRNEQKRIGRKFINSFLNEQKKKFFSTFQKSAAKIQYKQSVVEEIESILKQPIEPQAIKFFISSLDLDLPGKLIKDVYEFYKSSYEMGKNLKFEYVSPEHPQQVSNKRSAPLFAIALLELIEWVKNFEDKRLEIVTKAAKKANFKIALSFAKGDIYKWYKDTGSFTKCAQKLNAPNARPWISESFKIESQSDKNIFKHPNLIKEVIDYCHFHNIKLDDRFVNRCVRQQIEVI